MFPVIYLTGAPASGKSTLARNVRAKRADVSVFAYSEELRKLIGARRNVTMNEDDIRSLSAVIVTAADVAELDAQLISRVPRERVTNPFLIDSHPVTKESFGYRVTGFSSEQLKALSPDVIVCLYTSPNVALERIAADPMGRSAVSRFEAEFHTNLQCSVATQYGVLLGKPVYLLDSAVPETTLVTTFCKIAEL